MDLDGGLAAYLDLERKKLIFFSCVLVAAKKFGPSLLPSVK
jgi:hypothetical protein